MLLISKQLKTKLSFYSRYPRYSLWLIIFLFLNLLLLGCESTTNDDPEQDPPLQTSETPADSYFSLAVADNSHNHTGARLLFLDFQDSSADTSVIQNNIVIAPKLESGTLTLDGDISDWNQASLTTINGLVQNNYPLSKFIDATPTTIKAGAAWDDDYIYFVLQWEDTGHTKSTKYKKWVYGDQGNGKSGWNPKLNIGITADAPNELTANANHILAGEENEDRVLMMFPITDSEGHFAENGLGCAAYCHANLKDDNPNQNYTGTSVATMHTTATNDKADIWHWKALRTGGQSYADDKQIVYATGSNNGRIADSGTSAYTGNTLSGDNPAWIHPGLNGLSNTDDVLSQSTAVTFSDSPATGNEVPSILGRTPGGSRADVQASATYDDNTDLWTVEFRRLRDTGNSDDRQFISGTDAQPPGNTTVSSTDIATGSNLYSDNCVSCHKAEGIGFANDSGWSFPRVQRASGSLIMHALEEVSVMSNIKSNLGSTPQEVEQAAEDIAAYLQTEATFVTTNSLTVTVNGITTSSAVTSTTAGIDCPDVCKVEQTTGTSVTLTANALSSYLFSSWGGACSGTNPICSITLSSDLSVSADYTVSVTNYTLTVVGSANGTVFDGSGIDCGADCTEEYAAGSIVTLTATPGMGYQFNSWSGDVCSGQTSTICQFTLNTNVSVTPEFSTIVTPTCTNKGIIYDKNTSIDDDRFGLQMMINEGTVSNPTDLAFIPGSTTGFLVTAQRGTVHYFNGGCNPVNSIDISNTGSGGIGVVNGGEQGLLNVEFHPDYDGEDNKYLFFYHTSISGIVNSVSRMTMKFDELGNFQTLTDPVKIIDFRKIHTAYNHNGGGLVFAPDGTLLASVGDGGGDNYSDDLESSQLNTSLLGSVVRIFPNLDAEGGYTIPSKKTENTENMFVSSDPGKPYPKCSGVAVSPDSDPCPEILGMGLRNPYRMSIDGNIVYLGDVGGSHEEINSFNYTDASFNFGWPVHTGYTNSPTIPGYRDPILAYQKRDLIADDFRSEDPACSSDPDCIGQHASIMIGDVYRGSRYDYKNRSLTGMLLHAEFMDGFMRGLGVDLAGNTTNSGMHIIHHDGISAMIEGPEGYIYIATQEGAWGTGDADIVYRLVKP